MKNKILRGSCQLFMHEEGKKSVWVPPEFARFFSRFLFKKLAEIFGIFIMQAF